MPALCSFLCACGGAGAPLVLPHSSAIDGVRKQGAVIRSGSSAETALYLPKECVGTCGGSGMVGLGMGLGLGLSSNRRAAQPKNRDNGGPELLLQAELVVTGPRTAEGFLVRCAAYPWLEIIDHLSRDPKFLFQFAQAPRRFEEFIAACYERQGFDEVILTPRRGDGGSDVIAIKRGYGSIRFLDQTKAYSPGHLVTHDDVRAMLGVPRLQSRRRTRQPRPAPASCDRAPVAVSESDRRAG